MQTTNSSRARGRVARAVLALGLAVGGLALPTVAGANGAAPTVALTSPTSDQSFNTGPVSFSGTASDDGGVATVDVAIRNRDTLLYLTDSGTITGTSAKWFPTTLAAPNATATTWSWTSPTLPSGNYTLQMRVSDTPPPKVWYYATVFTRFGVFDAVGDPTPPTAQASLGGPLHAEFYSSGLELDPDGNIVIADTGNNQVAKYAPDGTQLWRVGAPGPDVNEFWHPRDVSVAADGRIFVVDTENERIVRLGPDGSWLGTFNGPESFPARFYLGGTVSGDKYYLADLGGRVRVFDLEGNQLQIMSEVPGTACSNLFDIRDAAADSAGNVYVAGYSTNSIIVFSPSGECLGAWGSTGTGDGQFRTPYGVFVGTDPVLGRELVYVTDALNNRVQVFETDGTFVDKFGAEGPASAEGTLYTLRRAAPAMDGSGDVWVADLWAFRLQRYQRTESTWTYAQTIGAIIGTTTDTTVFHEPRGLAVDPASGVVYVMDTVHHRVVRVNQDGTLASPASCGVRGSDNAQFNWPRDVAIDEATGDIWLADTKFNRLQVLRPNCTFVAKRGSAGSGLQQFNWVRAIEIRQSDRTLWAADTQNNRIVSWSVASKTAVASFGGQQGELLSQFNRPMGIAVDPTTGNILVADTINNRIAVMAADPGGANIRLLRYLSFGFNKPEAVAVAPDGTIYVADTGDSEIVVLSNAGGYLATFGASDGLDHPSGIATDAAGRVYVSDSFNDRVLIYSHAVFVPDTEAPVATLVSPASGQIVTTSPVTITGTATDNQAVAGVKVGVKDITTGLWWDGTSWTASFSAAVDAVLDSPGETSTTWSATFPASSTGNYFVQATPRDATPNTGVKVTRTFAYNPAPVDTVNPNGTVSTPTNNQVFTSSPITLTGNATDNVAVAEVRLSIRRNATNQFWDGASWTSSSGATVLAELDTPGAAASGWSYVLTPPASGAYGLIVTALDTAGRADTTLPNVAFSYTPPVPDTVNPNGTLATPTNNQVFTSSPITFTGNATDNVAVAAVRLSIKRNATTEYWDGATWTADTAATVDAELASPGATSTAWSYALAPPAGGTYRIVVTAVDTSGRVDTTLPNVGFTYTPPPADTVNPTVAISTPTSNQAVSLNVASLAITGSAADNVAVASVRVAIRNVPTGQYWNGEAWEAGFRTVQATLASPGATSTTWSYTWDLPPGTVRTTYALQVTSVDSANRTSTSATRNFSARG